ncbi:MAG: sigma-70 family RNA polymerase sigma factor [Actinomycetota bacterium]|nr:sigma-70 family RNA polymerase sigma factor [Actinomycetota bacterium]
MTSGSGEADRRARFDVLVQDAYVPLRRYLARRTDAADVDDVLSDTLLVMWRRLEDIPADTALPWCYGAARRCLANSRRAEGRRRSLLHRLAAQPDVHSQPAGAEAVVDAGTDLADALAALPDPDREVLQLWAWEQLEPREMAVVLGITANAASIRLHRAVKRMRQLMTDAPSEHASGKDAESPGHLRPRQSGPREGMEAPDDRT